MRHLACARHERHDGAQRPKKATEEDAGPTPFFKKGMSARQQLRVFRQRPHARNLVVVMIAEPIRDPVAKARAQHGGEIDRPEVDA